MKRIRHIAAVVFVAGPLFCGCGKGDDAAGRITALEKQNAQLAMQIVNLQQAVYNLQNANGVLDAKADAQGNLIKVLMDNGSKESIAIDDLEHGYGPIPWHAEMDDLTNRVEFMRTEIYQAENQEERDIAMLQKEMLRATNQVSQGAVP